MSTDQNDRPILRLLRWVPLVVLALAALTAGIIAILTRTAGEPDLGGPVVVETSAPATQRAGSSQEATQTPEAMPTDRPSANSHLQTSKPSSSPTQSARGAQRVRPAPPRAGTDDDDDDRDDADDDDDRDDDDDDDDDD